MTTPITIFLLDNFDSFTYNLVDELRVLGHELVVYRNQVSADLILTRMQQSAETGPVLLMLSPGPGEPSNAGCMAELIQKARGKFPVLGICLGHQAIVEHYGGSIVRADEVMHGKLSMVGHNRQSPFSNLPHPLPVARYHSLMAADMPAQLEVLAEIGQVPMAVCHSDDRMLGFQFHPESILTAYGSQLLAQSIEFLTADTHTIQHQQGNL